MEKITKRVVVYLVITCIISLIGLVSTCCIEEDFMIKFFTVLFLVIIHMVSSYDIALSGDKIIKQSNPELYEEFDKRNESVLPFKRITLGISSELLFSGRFKHYPHLKPLKISAVIYTLSFAIKVLAMFVITLL